MKRRDNRTGRITLCAMLSGMALVLLLLACLTPTGWIGVTALAGLCVAVAVCAAGYGGGIGCFATSGVLSVLLLPNKEVAVCYCLLFGLYPIAKAKIERFHRLGLEWALKLVLANFLMIAVYWLLLSVLSGAIPSYGLGPKGLWLLGNVVFICYDIAFSRVMTYVQNRLMPILRKNRMI